MEGGEWCSIVVEPTVSDTCLMVGYAGGVGSWHAPCTAWPESLQYVEAKALSQGLYVERY